MVPTTITYDTLPPHKFCALRCSLFCVQPYASESDDGDTEQSLVAQVQCVSEDDMCWTAVCTVHIPSD